MDYDKDSRIRARAYAIWMEEGHPHGRHEEHWHRAAREIEEEDKPRRAGRRRAEATTGSRAAPAESAGGVKTARRSGAAGSGRAAPKSGANEKKPGTTRMRRGTNVSAS